MTLHINYGPPMQWIHVRSEGEKWCFTCRARREFEYGVLRPTERSYYDPIPRIRCMRCKSSDSDLFPGRVREWTED